MHLFRGIEFLVEAADVNLPSDKRRKSRRPTYKKVQRLRNHSSALPHSLSNDARVPPPQKSPDSKVSRVVFSEVPEFRVSASTEIR